MKKKSNVVELKPTRPSQEITNEYSQLCAELGNSLIQFEMSKSLTLAKFQELNKEMQEAVAREAPEVERAKRLGEEAVKQAAEQAMNK